MPSIFDLMPASLWPVQPFVSPDEQTRTLVTLQSQLAPREPWTVPSLGSTEPNPAAATPQLGPAIAAAGSDLFPAPMLLSGSSSPNPAQLPPGFNDPVENAKTSWKTLGLIAGWEPLPDDLAPVPSPSAPYGVVAKSPLPPAFRPPPLPPAAWQMPEPDWSSTSPAGAGIVNPGRGADINPDDVIDPLGILGRYHRDLARLSDGLMPGSGNVISGDWDHISARDAANLALSVARNLALAPLGAESVGARATVAAKAAEVADAAGAAQAARAAALRGAARATGPHVDPADIPLVPADRPDPASALADARRQGIDLDALSARAHEFHSALEDDIAEGNRTTAVLLTDGPTIVGAGNIKDIYPAQRRLLREGEIEARRPNTDAEKTVLLKALKDGHRPRAIAATRKICEECQKFIELLGGTLTSDTTAVFPPY